MQSGSGVFQKWGAEGGGESFERKWLVFFFQSCLPSHGNHAPILLRARPPAARDPSVSASRSRDRSIVALWAARDSRIEAPRAFWRVGFFFRKTLFVGQSIASFFF